MNINRVVAKKRHEIAVEQAEIRPETTAYWAPLDAVAAAIR